MKHIVTILCSLAIAVAAQAQIIHVPGDYPTIQQGIDAASNGDTVLVAENTYYEQINFLGKAITLASQFLLDGDTSHIGKTIIDGSQITDPDKGSIVYFISGEDTTSILTGFTIQNGTIGTVDTTPLSYIIRSGGAVYVFGSGAKITYNHITHNSVVDTVNGVVQATTGAGISAGQWFEDSHWVVIDHNTIDHNSTSSDNLQTYGTGICVSCNTRIANNVISDNNCLGIGTAISGPAGFFAGGELFWANLTAEVRDNVIRNNIAISDNSFGGGAGFLQCVSAIFAGNLVENNVGILQTNLYSTGAVGMYGPRTGTSFSGNIFRHNTTTGRGGGIYLEYVDLNINADTVLLEGNYFMQNEASWGGALYTSDNPVVIKNNVFKGNLASNQGGAIRFQFLQSGIHNAILENNSFSENQADQRGGAISSLNGNPLIINSVFWNDSSDALYGPEIYMNYSADTAEIAYSNIDQGKISGSYLNGGGNINVDPLFEFEDLLIPYHWSPCIDAGAEGYTCTCGVLHRAPEYDLWQLPRPIGLGYDMGAYEQEAWGVGVTPIPNNEFGMKVSPNPFSTYTTFSYSLREPGQVVLKVFNGLWETVAVPVNTLQQKGEQQINWNSGNLPSGIYFYRIQAGDKVGTGKLLKL